MVASKSVIVPAATRLTHDEACRLCELAHASGAQSIVLDLSRSQEASTSAFARLVLLRRELLKTGRDLRIAALHGRPAKLFEVHRLDGVLPRISELAPAPPASEPRPSRAHSATPSITFPVRTSFELPAADAR